MDGHDLKHGTDYQVELSQPTENTSKNKRSLFLVRCGDGRDMRPRSRKLKYRKQEEDERGTYMKRSGHYGSLNYMKELLWVSLTRGNIHREDFTMNHTVRPKPHGSPIDDTI